MISYFKVYMEVKKNYDDDDDDDNDDDDDDDNNESLKCYCFVQLYH